MSSNLEEELKERLHTRKLDKLAASLSGACINKGHCYSIDNDKNIFVKTNTSTYGPVMFAGESESLKQINATKTIRAPEVHTVINNLDSSQTSAIVMEFLDISPLSGECARLLGKELAYLHDYNNKFLKFNQRAARWVGRKPPSVKHVLEAKADQRKESDHSDGSSDEDEEIQFSKHSVKTKNIANQKPHDEQNEFAEKFLPEPDTEAVEQFGFSVPTSCGLIPQVNEWTSEWVPFYARHRLDKAIRSLLSVHSDRELHEQWSHLQLKVDKFFSDYEPRGGDRIVPALLHGDLWSGNAAQFSDSSRGVVYDPSSFYGHSEYEFGIVRMFGGFPSQFESAYFEVLAKKKFFEKRNKLYQLFHHLNHWDHFGSGYRSSSLRLLKDLNAVKH